MAARKSYRTILAFLKGRDARIMAEVGVFGGGLCGFLLATYPNIEEYWAVDQWKVYNKGAGKLAVYDAEQWEHVHHVFRKNCLWSLKCREVWLPSIEAAKTFHPGYFDVVYIDANHTKEGALEDIQAWLPLVKEGGVLMGHDYTSRYKGVCRAVRECFVDDFKVLGKSTIWVKEVE